MVVMVAGLSSRLASSVGFLVHELSNGEPADRNDGDNSARVGRERVDRHGLVAPDVARVVKRALPVVEGGGRGGVQPVVVHLGQYALSHQGHRRGQECFFAYEHNLTKPRCGPLPIEH